MATGGRWRRGLGLALSAAAMVVTQVASVHPAAAVQGDTITDPCGDATGGLDIQQATRNTDPTTASFTITDCAPFTDPQTSFFIILDTNGDGIADSWVVLGYDTTSNAILAGVGPAGTAHLNAASVPARTTGSSSITVSFPRSLIGGSTTFDWAVVSVGGTSASPIIDVAPDAPTVHLPLPIRIAGADRDGTAVQASFFLDQTAGAVVLARNDSPYDALGGGPLAAAKNGPLLLTPTDSLDPQTLAEIQRVLPQGKTVYILGGDGAIAPAVESAVRAAGYNTVRFAGQDRYATSLLIADQGLGNPSTILLTTGINFPADALSAGAAAASQGGAILLTNGNQMDPGVASYLQSHPTDTVYAVGGPAAAADPQAKPIVGTDRYDTSVKVANQFFSSPSTVGIASGLSYPDALAGGATMGEGSAPMLLTDPTQLSAPTQSYLTANKASINKVAYLFGGTAAVSDTVASQIATALS